VTAIAWATRTQVTLPAELTQQLEKMERCLAERDWEGLAILRYLDAGNTILAGLYERIGMPDLARARAERLGGTREGAAQE
jgi:hypothetical protein